MLPFKIKKCVVGGDVDGGGEGGDEWKIPR
jgi:hypothetical protein